MSTHKDSKEIALKCKEPGCPETIRYKPKIVFSYTSPLADNAELTTKRVYLTCANGHQHVYEISG